MLRADNFFASIVVFLILAVIPFIFNNDLLRPFKETLTDFRITDVAFSRIKDHSMENVRFDLVVVNVDTCSKTSLAQLIIILNQYNPKVIAIDDVVWESDSTDSGESFLKDVIVHFKNIVVQSHLEGYSGNKNIFAENTIIDNFKTGDVPYGYDNLFISEDRSISTLRRFMPKALVENRIELSFPVRVVREFNEKIADDFLVRNNFYETIYYKGQNVFIVEDGSAVLAGEANPEMFANKIVLLGSLNPASSHESFDNLYFTPIDSIYSGRSKPEMTSTTIFANIIAMILDAKYFTTMPDWVGILIAFIFCYINMAYFSFITERRKRWYEFESLIVFLIESVFLLVVDVYIFLEYRIELKLTMALVASGASTMVFEGYMFSLKPVFIKGFYKFFPKR